MGRESEREFTGGEREDERELIGEKERDEIFGRERERPDWGRG